MGVWEDTVRTSGILTNARMDINDSTEYKEKSLNVTNVIVDGYQTISIATAYNSGDDDVFSVEENDFQRSLDSILASGNWLKINNNDSLLEAEIELSKLEISEIAKRNTTQLEQILIANSMNPRGDGLNRLFREDFTQNNVELISDEDEDDDDDIEVERSKVEEDSRRKPVTPSVDISSQLLVEVEVSDNASNSYNNDNSNELPGSLGDKGSDGWILQQK